MGRVLVHVDTAAEYLVNRRVAYVAISRGRHDVRIDTDDLTSDDVGHRSAMEPGLSPSASSESLKASVARHHAVQ